ncbi:MAG: sulfurtransferase TusA family protein [Anaerolineae bacterium]
MTTVDARGLSCPEPVLRTRNALAKLPQGEELEVLVETVTSRENVRRMAQSQGCRVDIEELNDGFRLLIKKV